MRIPYLIVAFCLLAACNSAPANDVAVPESAPAKTKYARVTVEGPIATAAERAACTAAGGSISAAGMMGREHCLQTYPDAGNACRGDADCLGTCRYQGEQVPPGTPVTGACQTVDVPFGCYSMVEAGVLGYALCVD